MLFLGKSFNIRIINNGRFYATNKNKVRIIIRAGAEYHLQISIRKTVKNHMMRIINKSYTIFIKNIFVVVKMRN